jgi:uncharacterized RDD family membrane protein YckC
VTEEKETGDAPERTSGSFESTLPVELLLDEEFDKLYERLKAEERDGEIRWGGFWRRASAFFVDSVVLGLLSLLLFYSAYVAYSVGLAAHYRALSWNRLEGFFRLLIFAWTLLVTGYFVLFHGMEGKTIGKWLLGLRVVGVRQEPITYSQALLRWIGLVVSAPFGLGLLWILWSREKRGWHDFLARTWVIRE